MPPLVTPARSRHALQLPSSGTANRCAFRFKRLAAAVLDGERTPQRRLAAIAARSGSRPRLARLTQQRAASWRADFPRRAPFVWPRPRPKLCTSPTLPLPPDKIRSGAHTCSQTAAVPQAAVAWEGWCRAQEAPLQRSPRSCNSPGPGCCRCLHATALRVRAPDDVACFCRDAASLTWRNGRRKNQRFPAQSARLLQTDAGGCRI